MIALEDDDRRIGRVRQEGVDHCQQAAVQIPDCVPVSRDEFFLIRHKLPVRAEDVGIVGRSEVREDELRAADEGHVW